MTKFKISVLLQWSLWLPATALADTVDIREWLVPWEESAPGHAYVDGAGRVWFISQNDNYVANFSPETSEFNRYDLRAQTGPSSLIVDANNILWFASNKGRSIGFLDPGTGQTTKIEMPDRKARDPVSLVFDGNGDIWFTVLKGNFVGRLQMATRSIELIPLPTKRVRPHGITTNSNGHTLGHRIRKKCAVKDQPFRHDRNGI